MMIHLRNINSHLKLKHTQQLTKCWKFISENENGKRMPNITTSKQIVLNLISSNLVKIILLFIYSFLSPMEHFHFLPQPHILFVVFLFVCVLCKVHVMLCVHIFSLCKWYYVIKINVKTFEIQQYVLKILSCF